MFFMTSLYSNINVKFYSESSHQNQLRFWGRANTLTEYFRSFHQAAYFLLLTYCLNIGSLGFTSDGFFIFRFRVWSYLLRILFFPEIILCTMSKQFFLNIFYALFFDNLYRTFTSQFKTATFIGK